MACMAFHGHALLQRLRELLADVSIPKDLVLEIDNGAAGSPHRFTGLQVDE